MVETPLLPAIYFLIFTIINTALNNNFFIIILYISIQYILCIVQIKIVISKKQQNKIYFSRVSNSIFLTFYQI